MILDNLLRSQERRARAQQDYYRAVTEYNKSIVQVHLLKGSLLEYNNICLQEGLGQTKPTGMRPNMLDVVMPQDTWTTERVGPRLSRKVHTNSISENQSKAMQVVRHQVS